MNWPEAIVSSVLFIVIGAIWVWYLKEEKSLPSLSVPSVWYPPLSTATNTPTWTVTTTSTPLTNDGCCGCCGDCEEEVEPEDVPTPDLPPANIVEEGVTSVPHPGKFQPKIRKEGELP